MKKIAVLGPEGSFSFSAYAVLESRAVGRFEVLTTDDNPSTILKFLNHESEYALTPVANNVTGIVSETLGFLAQMAYPSNGRSGHPFSVVGEVTIPVRHSLIGWKGDKLSSIRRVYSHPQGLMQCYTWIAENLPDAKLESCRSTSESIKLVTEPGTAAIAQPQNLIKGQRVLAEEINPAGNATRFLIVAQQGLGLPITITVNKASFVIGISDEPGSLLNALRPLALCQLEEIFSIPKPGDPTRKQRIFWLDLEYPRGLDLLQIIQDILVASADRIINLGAYGSLNEPMEERAQRCTAWSLGD